MAQTYKSGKVDISIVPEGGTGVTIPAHYLTEDGVTTTISEGTREINTMAGNFVTPSGTIEEANSVFSVVLPGMNYLKNIFPDLYTASVDRPSDAGQTVFGSSECSARGSAKLVIHYSCDNNSDDDIYIPNAQISYNATVTQNASDPLTVEITAYAQPSDDIGGGVAVYGTGSLTDETLFDPTTGDYESVAS